MKKAIVLVILCVLFGVILVGRAVLVDGLAQDKAPTIESAEIQFVRDFWRNALADGKSTNAILIPQTIYEDSKCSLDEGKNSSNSREMMDCR